MAKDSYWFRHDSTAGRALRMRKMAHIHGHWGKGIYWDVIEILRDQSNYCFDSDDTSLQMLCDLIGCKDEKKFITWFKDCVKFELFEIIENKFFSAVLCENMQKWETLKQNGGKGGRRVESKIEPKAQPNHQPEHEPKVEAKNNHNRIGEYIIGNDSIEEDKKQNPIPPLTNIDNESEMLNAEIWHSTVARPAGLKTVDEVKVWVGKYIDEMKAKELFLGRTLRDLKSHCVSWIKIEIEKEAKSFKNKQSSNPHSLRPMNYDEKL